MIGVPGAPIDERDTALMTTGQLHDYLNELLLDADLGKIDLLLETMRATPVDLC
jgi:hypothetical protein